MLSQAKDEDIVGVSISVLFLLQFPLLVVILYGVVAVGGLLSSHETLSEVLDYIPLNKC